MSNDPRRSLPSVGALLDSPAMQPLLRQSPRAVVADAVRDAVRMIRSDESMATPGPRAEDWLPIVSAALAKRERRSLRPVINATGVVLHTNLGRAPLPTVAIEAIASVARGQSNLEYDLEHGTRGSRYEHCASLLRELTGAEDALVVNNGAAALLLALHVHASGREAVISRGELVEIGGSFRVPDIMKTSGARLVEVGTTNRTHLADYVRAIGAETAALLKVHRSNFSVDGYVAEVSAAELASLGNARGVPLIHDLGSGLLVSLEAFGLSGEPTARDALAAGATLVTMSGDKLLGGPQAGIILGSSAAVGAMRRHPLLRTYRVDKLTLAALEATLALYRDPPRALREIPALAMLTASVDDLRARAERIRARVSADDVRVRDSRASVGGGAFPVAEIPSIALAVRAARVDALDARLRAGDPPVVGRISDGELLLDVRSVLPDDDLPLADALVRALSER